MRWGAGHGQNQTSLQVSSKPEHISALPGAPRHCPPPPVVVSRPSESPCSCRTSYRPQGSFLKGSCFQWVLVLKGCYEDKNSGGILWPDSDRVAPIFTVDGLWYPKLQLIFLNWNYCQRHHDHTFQQKQLHPGWGGSMKAGKVEPFAVPLTLSPQWAPSRYVGIVVQRCGVVLNHSWKTVLIKLYHIWSVSQYLYSSCFLMFFFLIQSSTPSFSSLVHPCSASKSWPLFNCCYIYTWVFLNT